MRSHGALVALGLALSALLLLPAAADELVFNSGGGQYNGGAFGSAPNQTFVSSPVVAPLFQVNLWDRAATASGGSHVFLAVQYAGAGAGPYVFSAADLSLVYAAPAFGSAHDARVQRGADGVPVLTFWEGARTDQGGHSNGWCVAYDGGYKVRWNVTTTGLNGSMADLHECQLTAQNTAVVTAYENIAFDVGAVAGAAGADGTGGSGGLLMDGVFQEIDIATGRPTFTWRASAHFPLADSLVPYSSAYGVGENQGWDFFHINSAWKSREGHYLVSSRHTSTISYVNGTSGELIWILGGRRNMFRDLSGGAATGFAWQHHARFLGGDPAELTFFDNAALSTAAGVNCSDPSTPCSRGMHVRLDHANMTAEVVREYFHPARLQSGAMGSCQVLGNDSGANVLTGWGTNPTWAEHAADGTPVWDVQFGPLVQINTTGASGGSGGGAPVGAAPLNYRVFRMDWTGTPPWRPAIARSAEGVGVGSTGGGNQTTVYVSWNGATEVREWVLLASNATTNIDGERFVVATARRSGFETTLTLGVAVNETALRRFVRAAALDLNGTVIGSSGVLDLVSGNVTDVDYNVTSVAQTETGVSSVGARRRGEANLGMMVVVVLFVVAWVGLGM